MWEVKKSTSNYVTLFFLLPLPLTWKILWHKDNIFISHGLRRTKRLQLSQGCQMLLYLHDYRSIFPPSRPFLCKTISANTEVHHWWSHFPGLALIICWRTFEKYFTLLAYVSSTTNISVRKECCNLWLKNLLVSHLLSLLLNTMIISLVISTEENMYYD